ncbi:S8 family peptidase [Methylobrevis albus]|uniref:S8 family peptidase n=1 Tax=Methylobrevis albus TaxID=2793297 RepID=A0A931I1C3_9HYPH|nr:S8 family peptidase [Methylobrevis albus]MBH0237466.1 S8 family peptidase [Methylobrevis albus]
MADKADPNAGEDISDSLARSPLAADLRAVIKERRAPGSGDGRRRGGDGRFLSASESVADARFDVVIEFNTGFPGGVGTARRLLLEGFQRRQLHAGLQLPEIDQRLMDRLTIMPITAALAEVDLDEIMRCFDADDSLQISNSLWTENYAFGRLSYAALLAITGLRVAPAEPSARRWRLAHAGFGDRRELMPLVHRVWRDQPIETFVYESQRTIKCDAARAAFAAAGADIVWAVADTGIDGGHPHFATHGTLDLPATLLHRDFTGLHADDAVAAAAALVDEDGHGSHVAGIVAGETPAVPGGHRVVGKVRDIDAEGRETTRDETTTLELAVSGIAPRCKLLSLKVLKTRKNGALSHLMAALGYVHRVNDYGRTLKIHGINLSLGYPFDPAWFAAGQSPLCGEVERLVKSGVVVVVAAGNGGYGTVVTHAGSTERAAHGGTIADPGNAELAITVGATHRDMPHAYGVSFFSAKGPTADGRMKPDLVAPGERIVSCAAATSDAGKSGAAFREESGTSMAAPHVSGAIAAFMSVRKEFRGRPERMKRIFMESATDLRRRPEFQGAGLIDLMRALQSV